MARRPASKRGDHRATPAGAVALEAGREGRGESGAPGFLPSVSPRQSRGHRAGDGAEGTWAPARHVAHSPPRRPLPRELGRPRAGTTRNPGCRAARACPTP